MCDSDRQTVGTREKSACASETASERVSFYTVVALKMLEIEREKDIQIYRYRYIYLCREREIARDRHIN